MIKKITLFVCMYLFINSNAKTKESVPPENFFKCWKASYEENNEKTKTDIYRPCSYEKFKPRMFRLEVEFFKAGKCKYLQVGAADLHYYVEGKWTYNKKTKTITVSDDKDVITYKFKLKKINKELMETIPLN
jgi:hypothetical protein